MQLPAVCSTLPRLAAVLVLAAAGLVPRAATAVTIDWVPIGNPGNPAGPSIDCFAASCGSVSSSYNISKYEVTNAQYAEFLNAKAATDTTNLYNTSMGSNPGFGGITRSGASGSYIYSVKTGFADKPVTYVSFYDSLRFANWLNNGQGGADTETGAYTITPTGITNNTITRNALANTFLTSENEWYKAAYYSPGGVYFDFPTGTNNSIGCVAPESDTGNSANCSPYAFPFGTLTNAGAYLLSDSPYGTYDQGGNVYEWNEQIVNGSLRELRGGYWGIAGGTLEGSHWSAVDPSGELGSIGFRVASLIPEPSTGLLMMTGLLGLAYRQRRCVRAAHGVRP